MKEFIKDLFFTKRKDVIEFKMQIDNLRKRVEQLEKKQNERN
jgi:polyhydroxyalkanoate synthesis regulator phasin